MGILNLVRDVVSSGVARVATVPFISRGLFGKFSEILLSFSVLLLCLTFKLNTAPSKHSAGTAHYISHCQQTP
jgi:hypothetical protein